MKATKINNEDIWELKISSLPTRPTAPTAFGGAGFSAKEMKEAFDKLPLYIVSKYNDLIDDILSGEIAEQLPTGIKADHTLSSLLSDITNGNLSSYFMISGASLGSILADFEVRISELEGAK